GEQGRGFAVVASEVRNLAQRSATAAKEIKALIEDSVTKVRDGSDLVNASGDTLAEIVGSVNQVSTIVAQISGASREQAVGIDQIRQTISQLDDMTQRNAALVEEAASTSGSVSEQSRVLDGLMGFFRLGEVDGHTASTGVMLSEDRHDYAAEIAASHDRPPGASHPLASDAA
ncbi:MAG: methyl-accepting chemotaxis protein, partial [Gammaproteobacteria bacterium]|nr:methyl-accepting chemotaxis protein [Gammaproteobacteria bacterium]